MYIKYNKIKKYILDGYYRHFITFHVMIKKYILHIYFKFEYDTYNDIILIKDPTDYNQKYEKVEQALGHRISLQE